MDCSRGADVGRGRQGAYGAEARRPGLEEEGGGEWSRRRVGKGYIHGREAADVQGPPSILRQSAAFRQDDPRRRTYTQNPDHGRASAVPARAGGWDGAPVRQAAGGSNKKDDEVVPEGESF